MNAFRSHIDFWKILVILLAGVTVFFVSHAHAGGVDPGLEKRMKDMGIIPMAGILTPTDHELKDLDGKSVRLSDFIGKVVFLNFWTTWCPDCVNEMPDIEKLYRKINHPDFIIIALNLKESPQTVRKFVNQHNLSFHFLLDPKGNTGRAFGIRSIPTTFILDRDGGIIGKAMGSRKWHSRMSADIFKSLIEQQAR